MPPKENEMSEIILKSVEAPFMTREINFKPGDTVKVHTKIIEGDRRRIQVYQGTVIAIKNNGVSKTFTVRKLSSGIGVERTFFLQSPMIEKIELHQAGRVRRAKIYYIRDKKGKAARIAQKQRTVAN